MESEVISNIAAWASMFCLATSFFWPWNLFWPLKERRSSRSDRVPQAALWALAATLLYLVCHLTLPIYYNIRVDLILYPPLLLAAWVQCLVLWAKK